MKRALALVVASATALTACGGSDAADDAAGDASGEPRTIEVSMTDMAFTPADLDVAVGETIRFVFRNDGAVRHEAVFGDQSEQEAHHAEMAEMGGTHDGMDMESMPHDDMTELHSIIVEPGETAEITHTFDTPGPMMIGCHEPGHWEAGMKMIIDV